MTRNNLHLHVELPRFTKTLSFYNSKKENHFNLYNYLIIDGYSINSTVISYFSCYI